ncbi:MAG: PAS domain S-box protein, partial [Actinomycetota bacterium]|nr:PAS domain S-box protein [Actinomycetota bacterium]
MLSFEEANIDVEQITSTESRIVEGTPGRGARLYRSLVDNALDMISVCSVENTFLYVSPSVERVLGYRPEELVGATVSDLVHPDDLAGYGQRIIEEIQTASGPFGPIEARYRRKDGSWRHLETTMNVLVDDPDVEGIVCVSRDVTERRHLEEEIRLLNKSLEERVAERAAQLEAANRKIVESEERYRSVVEQAADGILLIDVDSKHVLEANAVYQDLLGYTPEEVLRLTLYDLVPYPREAMDCYVERVLEQKSYVSGERRHRRKDGSLVDVEVSANVISYSGEETLCIVVRDITERKRAAEILRE